MTTKTTNKKEQEVFQPKLYLAFELSNAEWKLGFTIGHRKRPRMRTITAGDLMALQEEVHRAKKRFRMPEDILVVSCYEAGRDGFSRRTPCVPRARRCETASGRCGYIAT